MAKGKNYQPLSAMEQSIVATVSRATFPPATGPKRFIGHLAAGYTKQLSDGGRQYLAWIAQRFRRQYTLSESQWIWIRDHIYEDEKATVKTTVPDQQQQMVY